MAPWAMTAHLVDISRPLGEATPAYPGDTLLHVFWPTVEPPPPAVVSALTLSPHLATHVDAPLHLDPAGADAATLGLSAFFGPCLVVAVPEGRLEIEPDTVPDLAGTIPPRVLLRTGSWPVGTGIPESHPAPTPALIDHLADRGVVLLGVDTPSVDAPADPLLPVHRRCLDRGIAIVEGLDLAPAAPGLYTLVALPLRLVGVEASPVRAVLLPNPGSPQALP